jgi:hypothetical protein
MHARAASRRGFDGKSATFCPFLVGVCAASAAFSSEIPWHALCKQPALEPENSRAAPARCSPSGDDNKD